MRLAAIVSLVAVVLWACGAVLAQQNAQQEPLPAPAARPIQTPKVGQPGQTEQGQPSPSAQNTVSANYSYGAPLFQLGQVRSTLELTADQVNRLNTANDQLRQQYEGQVAKLQSLAPAERVAALQKLQAGHEAALARSTGDILTPEQARRLQQLDYQAQGPAAFGKADVRSRLGLSAEQVRRLQELQHENAGFLGNFVSPGGSGQDPITLFEVHQQRMSSKVTAVLDVRQRQIWREMIGDSYLFQPNLANLSVPVTTDQG
jgi:hypothetical protein